MVMPMMSMTTMAMVTTMAMMAAAMALLYAIVFWHK